MALQKRRSRRRHRYFHLRGRRHNHHPLQRVRQRQRRQRRRRHHRHYHCVQRVLPLLPLWRRRPLLQLSQRLSRLPTGQQCCLRHHCRRLQPITTRHWQSGGSPSDAGPPPQRMPAPLQLCPGPSPHHQPHLQPPGCPPGSLSHCPQVLLSDSLPEEEECGVGPVRPPTERCLGPTERWRHVHSFTGSTDPSSKLD